MRRRLGLTRETLTQLTTGEMAEVVGGSHGCPTNDCDTLTHGPSIDQTCPTVPPTVCQIDFTRLLTCYT